ncbi:hypothetical protein [Chelatococcus reniformis]|uniref:Uncharacterized protein n=1 Tax=Chelatococcus reniformis TaxID=1494448 RepID=A0A916UFL1_9HYPH|nr:hypothetical protein [Chelatococcus reniformis]GGC70489.1 hypothetical protein GCM10010994_31270 [Chelatococcus reniformis]
MSAPAIDRNLYIVIAKHPSGDYIPETSLINATAEQVVVDLYDGQYGDIEAVYRFNPAAGTSARADAEIAELLSEYSRAILNTPHAGVRDFIEAHGFDFYRTDEFISDERTFHREMARAA